MLNLRAITQRLTQGQPAADRVLAQRGGASGEDTTPPAGSPPSEAAGAAAPAAGAPGVDAQAVARRVYELMRQDLTVERDRRGRRR